MPKQRQLTPTEQAQQAIDAKRRWLVVGFLELHGLIETTVKLGNVRLTQADYMAEQIQAIEDMGFQLHTFTMPGWVCLFRRID